MGVDVYGLQNNRQWVDGPKYHDLTKRIKAMRLAHALRRQRETELNRQGTKAPVRPAP